MLPEKMNEAMNEQVAKEFYAEYLYLSMAVEFAEKAWMALQIGFQTSRRRTRTCNEIYKFILERGGKVVVPAIQNQTSKQKSISTT